MPSHEANKETIHYGDSLLLLNQYAIPDTSATAGYLDKYGGDDGEKTYDGVRTSQDPDRANGSGTWKLEPQGRTKRKHNRQRTIIILLYLTILGKLNKS